MEKTMHVVTNVEIEIQKRFNIEYNIRNYKCGEVDIGEKEETKKHCGS